jgi:hypothetical protein
MHTQVEAAPVDVKCLIQCLEELVTVVAMDSKVRLKIGVESNPSWV